METSPPPEVASKPSVAVQDVPTPAKPKAPPEVVVPKESPKEDYAPASHIAQDADTQAAATPATIYAPKTHIGESQAVNLPVTKIALLLPLSGDSPLKEDPVFGKSLLDAAVLALYDKYATLAARDVTTQVELLPKDTGDSIEGAEKAAQDAVQEGASLILGPAYSKQVNVVAGVARQKHVPVITFSNNLTIAGDGVYLFGFVPEQQVVRIVQYALSHGIENIAALVPSSPYGAAIVKQLSTEVRKHNGHVHPIEYYAEDMATLDTNVGRLARFFSDEPNKKQALFIAEGGQKLKQITDTLAASGITNKTVQLLGTGLWDDPTLLQWPAVTGGWFATSAPDKYQVFEKHFQTVYAYQPDRRASLSYDAVALVMNLALASGGKEFVKESILDPVGFNGPANGIFRFHDDGSIERGLSILSPAGGTFRVIEPAPTTFNP